MELERYGVTVNAIAPTALTRLTEDLGLGGADEKTKAAMDPRWIAPLATWLASTQSAGVTGRVFEASGAYLAVAESWHRGPSTQAIDDPTKVDAVDPQAARRRPPERRHVRQRQEELTPGGTQVTTAARARSTSTRSNHVSSSVTMRATRAGFRRRRDRAPRTGRRRCRTAGPGRAGARHACRFGAGADLGERVRG